jgi:RNA polymerase sigma-54 factor
LSDSQIAEMLKEQGIECARRTVAKYREALKIAPANLRKAL